MDGKPKRHWFRFSLGSLFGAMTAIAIWLGWEASVVRERSTLVAEGKDNGTWTAVYSNKTLPWNMGTLMGDVPVERFEVTIEISPEDFARLNNVFPEAEFLELFDFNGVEMLRPKKLK